MCIHTGMHELVNIYRFLVHMAYGAMHAMVASIKEMVCVYGRPMAKIVYVCND